MKIPDPYFENVPNYGTMHMEQVVIDYDYPLLSVLKDDKGKRYLSICYSVMDAQRWVVAPISTSELIKLLTNRIPIATPYRKCESGIVIATRDYSTRQDSFRIITTTEIPEECLPDADELLDAEDDEWLEYIKCIQAEDSNWKESSHRTSIYLSHYQGRYSDRLVSYIVRSYPSVQTQEAHTGKVEKSQTVRNYQERWLAFA